MACVLVPFGWMLLDPEILTRFNIAFDPNPVIYLNLMLEKTTKPDADLGEIKAALRSA